MEAIGSKIEYVFFVIVFIETRKWKRINSMSFKKNDWGTKVITTKSSSVKWLGSDTILEAF